MINPLRVAKDLPPFSQIKLEHIEPAVRELLAENQKIINGLLASETPYTWDNLIYPLENMNDNLRETWGIVKHLNAVNDNPNLRKVYDTVLPLVTEYFINLGHNSNVYEAIVSVQKSTEYEKLNLEQKKVVENYLHDYQLSGISLEKEKKEQFKILQQKLSQVKNRFSHNVLDATDSWFLLITDETRLSGLPTHTIQQAKKAAEKNQELGWRITLDYPCYHAVMSFAEDRELRKEVYTGYHTLASDQSSFGSQWDNAQEIVEELQIKQKIAALLGFECFAEYSLVKKMLKKPNDVMQFLQELIIPLKKQALEDSETLQIFAAEEFHITDIQAWDIGFLSEKLLEKHYTLSEEALRSYFPESQVIQGLFSVVKKLFNINIQKIDTVDIWDPTVQLFEMRDEGNQLLGRFYMDLYARPHKRKGAWCDSCKSRKKMVDGSIQTPISYVVCNFRPALEEEKEALLSHEEVITLFHEFGHCLHFILAKVIYPSIGPDRGVSWDAIELPSQLMENWCWEEEVMPLISKHIETGESLPEDLFTKLKSSKNFLVGLSMVRQLEFALFDFELHLQKNPSTYLDVLSILHKVRDKTSVIPVPTFNRFPNTFSHIFAGGYAAGYYSYLWSEVLSADTFNFFKEKQQVFDQAVAKRYLQEILEPGGSKEFMDLYLAFRGRPPRVEALLKDWGL